MRALSIALKDLQIFFKDRGAVVQLFAIPLLFIIAYPLYVLKRNSLKTTTGNLMLFVLTNVFGVVTLATFVLWMLVLFAGNMNGM